MNRRFILRLFSKCQPVGHSGDRLAEKRKSWLGGIKAGRPAANSGGIGLAVGILEPRHCLFPRTVLHKMPQQCLATCQQAVMRIRKRKQRKKSERHSALDTATPTNTDPVMVLVVSLLAAPAVADDRIALTNRTMA